MGPESVRHSITVFKYLEWCFGFLADGATLAGAFLIAREAWDTKRYMKSVENVKRSLDALRERGHAPVVNGIEIRSPADSDLLARIRAARRGLAWVIVGFFLAIIARLFGVMAELNS